MAAKKTAAAFLTNVERLDLRRPDQYKIKHQQSNAPRC